MSNFIYDQAANAAWAGDIAFDTDNVKCYLIDLALYTANAATDQFVSDIPAGAIKATSANLTGKTIVNRTIDANSLAFSSVAAGDPCEAVVIAIDTGVTTTSRLLVYIDTATGLPATPNGTDINIEFNAAGIAKF